MVRSLLGAAPFWAAAVLMLPAAAQAQNLAPVGASIHRSRHTATGTMAAFDPETRQLTVASAIGSAAYHLAADARVWLGNKRLPVSQLKARVGVQVTVSWSDADGVRTTHTVRLAGDPSGKTP